LSPTKDKTKAKAGKLWKCGTTGCNKSYARKGDLADDELQIHIKPNCFVSGCTDPTVYNGEKSLFQDHIIQEHPAAGAPHAHLKNQYVATFSCPIVDCSSNIQLRFYSSRSWSCAPFARHLETAHGITDGEQRKGLLPRFAGNPCAFPGCVSVELFGVNDKGKSDHKDHLALIHGVDDANERYEYSWERVRDMVMPLKR
jgi:hypothetical protein